MSKIEERAGFDDKTRLRLLEIDSDKHEAMLQAMNRYMLMILSGVTTGFILMAARMILERQGVPLP